jgi:hypothetical protein
MQKEPVFILKGTPNGRGLALYFTDGTMVPGQRDLVVNSPGGGPLSVTVNLIGVAVKEVTVPTDALPCWQCVKRSEEKGDWAMKPGKIYRCSTCGEYQQGPSVLPTEAETGGAGPY